LRTSSMLWLKFTTRSPPTRSASTSQSQTHSKRRYWTPRNNELHSNLIIDLFLRWTLNAGTEKMKLNWGMN
jgi:hypothetical protein